MIQMSSRASPGGSSALRHRWTRRSELVTVPSASAHDADPGSTTSASSAVARQDDVLDDEEVEPLEQLHRRCLRSASESAGFSPITYSVRSSPRSIASNIWVRCQP